MKKHTLIFSIALLAITSQAQNVSNDKILEKAKQEGVSPADFDGYLKRENEKNKAGLAPAEKTTSKRFSQLTGDNFSARINNASTCGNLDFEDGNFNGWGIFTGVNVNSLMTPSNVVIDAMPYTSGQNNSNGRHAIIDSVNSYDIWSSVPLLSNYSGKTITRLNDMINNAEASILERNFVVTANQPYLNFSYAAFLENAGHTTAEQPYVSIVVLDSNGIAIPGTSLSIIATLSVNAGFTQVTNGSFSYFYKSWTPVVYNLSAYIGQPVTFQAIAADCSLGGHNGHAYFDFDCGGPLAGVANVWPGDANYDLTVDFLDLFYLGAGFGTNGTVRATTGNSWAAVPSNNWYLNSLYQVDAKHADCNGDGTISFADTLAINLNYGLGHAFKSNALTLTAENNALPSEVSIFPSANNIYAGQPFTVEFNIGDNANLVDSIYAIGFSLDYPAQLLDNSESALDCSSSVLNNSNNGHLKIFKQIGNTADLAISKINKQNATNTQGNIFTLNLRAATVILADEIVKLKISNMKAITSHGSEIPLTATEYPIKFKASDATGLSLVKDQGFSIFPNPAANEISIKTNGANKIQKVQIFSLIGTVVKSTSPEKKESLDIDISELNKGAYLLQLQLENGSILTRNFIKL